jgi:hypothetical protein
VCDRNEIDAMLRGPGDLRQRIVRSLGSSTVALFGIFDSKGVELLKFAGTGSLVLVDDSPGILTAAHVWEVLKSAVKMGITLTDKINHKCLIDVPAVVPTIIRGSDGWDEWGPDLAFLRIPVELVGGIKAFQVFEDLKAPPKPLHAELWNVGLRWALPRNWESLLKRTRKYRSAATFGGVQRRAQRLDHRGRRRLTQYRLCRRRPAGDP